MTEALPDLSAFRRVALWLTIGSFSIAALMGIVALLGGGDFGENEARILLTTLVVGSASVCVLCYLATGATPYQVVGIAGGTVVVVPIVTALMLIWRDWDLLEGPSEATWKSFGVGLVLAATLAQASLLLGLAWARRSLAWLLWSTLALAALLAALVSGVILGSVEADEAWRALGIVAILDVLGTVLTAAVAKFGGRRDAPAALRGDLAPEPAVGPAVGRAVGLAVGLPDQLAARLEERARATGRSPAHLVAEAVERYLAETG